MIGTDFIQFNNPTRIGSRIRGGLSGSVLFIDANGRLAQDNANLLWDNVNKRLGIGTTNPAHLLHLVSGTKTAYFSFSGAPLLMVGGPTDYNASIQLNEGRIRFGRDGSSGGGFFHNNDSFMRAQQANSFWIHDTSFSPASDPTMPDLSNATGGSVKGGLRLQTVFTDTVPDAGKDKIALRVRVTDGGTGNKFLASFQNGTTPQFSVRLDGTGYFAGNVGIGTTTPTARLDIDSNTFRLRTAKTINSSGESGNQGDICWNADYLYICVNTNSWKRVALSSF